mmetsp:Transcript_5638/g.10682  ORF Transcript_5638/g.10682 Transcript_5638/m.10682 type:complete len:83 (+) Transcript_5638:175-423(+)
MKFINVTKAAHKKAINIMGADAMKTTTQKQVDIFTLSAGRAMGQQQQDLYMLIMVSGGKPRSRVRKNTTNPKGKRMNAIPAT